MIRRDSILIFIMIIFSLQSYGKNPTMETGSIKIDTVTIRKNWRTKEAIILRELGINKGDKVTVPEYKSRAGRLLWHKCQVRKYKYRYPPSALIPEHDSRRPLQLWYNIKLQV